jgi:hypothetical protein
VRKEKREAGPQLLRESLKVNQAKVRAEDQCQRARDQNQKEVSECFEDLNFAGMSKSEGRK